MSKIIGFTAFVYVGLIYGFSLLGLGFLAAGAGHGTSLVWLIAGSPLWYYFHLLPYAWLTISVFVAVPLFWVGVGATLGLSQHRLPRSLFVGLILSHYAVLPFTLMNADWHRLDRVLWFFVFSMVFYAAGQVAIWIGFFVQLRVAVKNDSVRPIDGLLMTAAFVVFCAVPALVQFVYIPSQADKSYDFKIAESRHEWTVQLEKVHHAKDAPAFADGRGQGVSCCAFTSGPTLHCLRPLKFGGEICTWTPEDGKYRCVKINQPAGVANANGFSSMFDDTGIWVNSKGDQFLRWQLLGNGDHALALREQGADQIKVTRIKLSLANTSKAICSPDGVWHMVVWHGGHRGIEIAVYAVNAKMELTLLGTHHSNGHHDIGVLDAAFVNKDRLHIVWADVEPGGKIRGNWLKIRTIDFDPGESSWTNERELWRLDRFVSSTRTAVHVLDDGSVHYVWRIDEGQKRGGASGIFYQAADGQEPMLLSTSDNGFRSVVVRNKIVVAFSETVEPEKVLFRIVADRLAGPIGSIKIADAQKQPLHQEYMEMGSGVADTFWFVNQLDFKTIYELKAARKP